MTLSVHSALLSDPDAAAQTIVTQEPSDETRAIWLAWRAKFGDPDDPQRDAVEEHNSMQIRSDR